MPMNQSQIQSFIVAHWGLAGTSAAGKPGYRSQNPWQALESYMELNRDDASTFFSANGASATRIDSGGSVWRVDLNAIPTPEGLLIDDFAYELLTRLVRQNPTPDYGDYICVSYAQAGSIGRWDWRL